MYSIRAAGIELSAISYGAIITSLDVPDRDGNLGDVVLGHAELEPYLHNAAYLGAVVGRCANRIARGRFRLDDITYQLATNDGPNHLHGGAHGFDQQLWAATVIQTDKGAGVAFSRSSPAEEEQYPGTLRVSVTYLMTFDGSIVLRYFAETDAPTIVNLTQHTYFNLAGESSSSVLDHELTLRADAYTPVGPFLIPTGEITDVDRTNFDFRTPVRIGDRGRVSDPQLSTAGGFDHNFVLSPRGSEPVVELRDCSSGRVLHLSTTEPGLQFYDGHMLDGRTVGAYGRVFHPCAGLCLETQHFPDSPNQPHFPPVTLRPGESYRSMTTWRFTTR